MSLWDFQYLWHLTNLISGIVFLTSEPSKINKFLFIHLWCLCVGSTLHRLVQLLRDRGGAEVLPGEVHREQHQSEGGRGGIPEQGGHGEALRGGRRGHGIRRRGPGELGEAGEFKGVFLNHWEMLMIPVWLYFL